MSKFLHKRINGPAKDDIEAHPTSSHHTGDGSPSRHSAIGEYSALDRYISTYGEDTGAEGQEKAQERKTGPRWWQFWKSPGDDKQTSSDRTGEVPDNWLATDINSGISQSIAGERRKMVGWNELTTEKKNVFFKLITYFMGPILYGKPPRYPLPQGQRS